MASDERYSCVGSWRIYSKLIMVVQVVLVIRGGLFACMLNIAFYFKEVSNNLY